MPPLEDFGLREEGEASSSSSSSGEEEQSPATTPSRQPPRLGFGSARRRLAAAAGASLALVALGGLCAARAASGGNGARLRSPLRHSQLQVKEEHAATQERRGHEEADAAHETVQRSAAARRPPHLILVLIDDLGFNDFKDSKDLGPSWPFVNSIANQSVFVNTTYTEAWCAPSRASLLTGRYFHLLSHEEFSSKEETTLAQKLNSVGYMSYAIGKWHLGWESWRLTPMGRGFSRYLGNLMNPDDHYTHCSKDVKKQQHLGAPVAQAEPSTPMLYYDMSYMESYPFFKDSSSQENPFRDSVGGAVGLYDAQVYDKAAEIFLVDHKDKFPDKPFFLYYAMYADHHPYQADDRWKVNCHDIPAEGRRNLCGMQAAADSALHNLTTLMTKHYAGEDYVVVLTGDNGGMIGKGKVARGWSNNEPLRGQKFTDWEGGVRSRAMIFGRHPDLQASSMLGKMYMGGFMHLVDWHATLAELGGAPLDGEHFPASGKSIWKAVLSNSISPRQSIRIASGYDGVAYFRSGDWVLMSFTADEDKEAMRAAPPVFPVPKTRYEDTMEDFLTYKGNHPGVKVELPALFNIWSDVSMSSPSENSKQLEDMKQRLVDWLAQSGTKSAHLDLGCPSSSCKAMREAAKDKALEAAIASLDGTGPEECGSAALTPYVDDVPCSCLEADADHSEGE